MNVSAPVGILASGGVLPLDLAAAIVASGRPVHIVGYEGFADPAIAAHPHEWVNLGQVSRLLGSFRRAGCREIVIVGVLQRPNLWRLRFDFGLLKYLPTVIRLTRGGDDSVLRRCVRFFEGEGFTVRGVGDLAPMLLAQAGPLGQRTPAERNTPALLRAERAIQALGPFDLGQAVVATADRIVAVEGSRGTDAMLRELGPGGSGAGLGAGGVLVKLAKPEQEMRVDLPTIGPVTIERAAAAGLAGIGVGAGNAIILDRAAVRTKADACGLFVVGLPVSGTPAGAAIAAASLHGPPLTILGRSLPTPSDRRDIAVARRLLAVLAAQGAGSAAVVSGEHVLAVSGQLPVEGLIRPLGGRSQWGLFALRGKIGTLALRLDQNDRDGPGSGPGTAQGTAQGTGLGIELFRAAQEARLAGIACFGGPIPEAARADAIAWANEARMFLMEEPASHQ